MSEKRTICGFCGRPSSNLTTLSIHGNHIDFCDECITLCCEISEEYDQLFASENDDALDADILEEKALTLPKPAQIKEELDKFVIGQENY